MIQKVKVLSAFLAILLFIEIPTPSSGFGMLGGGGGGSSSSVAEILAAGLITGMLMSKPKSMPMIQELHHHLMGGYRAMHSARHAMYPMLSARYPMMGGSLIYPMVRRPHYKFVNQALITQAATEHEEIKALSRLNEEIKALEAQESMLEAALARVRQGAAEPALNELLSEEETIPAAALLLETAELMDQTTGLSKPHMLPPPEMFQAAASEQESRYLLPRIVRHFVQRLMRRGEQH